MANFFQTVVYSINSDDKNHDYSTFFSSAMCINIKTKNNFSDILVCIHHAKALNPEVIFIINSDYAFDIQPNEIESVRNFKDLFDVLALNSYTDNNCFMLNTKAIQYIDSLEKKATDLPELIKLCANNISFGKLSRDILYPKYAYPSYNDTVNKPQETSNTSYNEFFNNKKNDDSTQPTEINYGSNDDIKVAVCAIGKMENNYIREWVEHYKNFGFDNVILYDNNDITGEHFQDVIGDYINSGYVILKNVRGQKGTTIWVDRYTSIQIESYNNCFHEYRDKYDWIFFCDIDEFLMRGDNIHDIHQILKNHKYDNYDAVKVCWKYYDDNNLIKVENGNYNCVERFTHYNPTTWPHNAQTKMFLRTKKDITINCAHGVTNAFKFYVPITVCDALGLEDNTNNGFGIAHMFTKHREMWLNHYRYKTIEEFYTNKLIRKYPDSYTPPSLGDFWSGNERTLEKEDYIKELNKKFKNQK